MYKIFRFFILINSFIAAGYIQGNAQGTLPDNINKGTQGQVRYDAQGRIIRVPANSPQQDSLKHRDSNEDSITIFFRYFDSTRIRQLDTSINNFSSRFPLPAHYVTLGNLGAAAHSLLFNPNLKPGFDPGFHSFDIYKLKIEDTRFYQTTRPYTEIGYLLGSKAEQTVNVVHTQNVKPNFNMAFQYRLINSPGNMQNQNANHNSFRLNGNFQSNNKRYTAYAIYLTNKTSASENGGIRDDNLLTDSRYNNRTLIPTRLSGVDNPQVNPFSTKVATGNVYGEKTFLLRQQYDFGQSDSLVVNDSTVIKLFYPRFRVQHTFNYLSQTYEFRDEYAGSNKVDYYKQYFNITLPNNLSFKFKDTWQDIKNDFSIISFPEKNNLNQFIKAGIAHQYLSGIFSDSNFRKDYNIFLNGEYRNRTRNQKWDLEATGRFYLNGFNSGDYAAKAELKRFVSNKVGYLQLGFQNVNRTPSYIFESKSSFPVYFAGDLKKENITKLSASLIKSENDFLTGQYYLVSNYSYFDSFFTARQESAIFNLLHVSAGKTFKRFWRNLSWYAEVHVQKSTGNAPVNLPLIFTSNRFAFEGVYHKNMTYAYGVEIRYHSPYKPDNYSPFLGQFFYQNGYTISNRPEVNLFFNFRIKTFKAFLRGENLNTLIGNKNNLAAEHYPTQGVWIRVGVWWTFVN